MDSTKDAINNSMENKTVTESDVKVNADGDEDSKSMLTTLTNTSSDCKNYKTNIPEYKIVHRGYFDLQNFTYTRYVFF